MRALAIHAQINTTMALRAVEMNHISLLKILSVVVRDLESPPIFMLSFIAWENKFIFLHLLFLNLSITLQLKIHVTLKIRNIY
jgi:hypothetical protein